MSNQLSTAKVAVAKVVVPAVRQLNLEIALINDTTVRVPYGSMRMHARTPRAVTAG